MWVLAHFLVYFAGCQICIHIILGDAEQWECSFSLKGLMWVVVLSSDGEKKTRKIGPVMKMNEKLSIHYCGCFSGKCCRNVSGGCFVLDGEKRWGILQSHPNKTKLHISWFIHHRSSWGKLSMTHVCSCVHTESCKFEREQVKLPHFSQGPWMTLLTDS